MDWLSFALGAVCGWVGGATVAWAFVALIGGAGRDLTRIILDTPTHAEWRVERRPARED